MKGNGFFVNAFWSRHSLARPWKQDILPILPGRPAPTAGLVKSRMKKWFLRKKNAQPASGPPPFRIGIWCDVGFTLSMRIGGIGVFVYKLVEGLFALDEPIEVTMLVRPGDQHMMDCLKGTARGRLRVVPELPPRPPLLLRWMDNIVRQWSVGQRLVIREVKDDDPKFFVLFGSTLGRAGMDGQTDYTAAADVLPKIAAQLSGERPHTRSFTLAWTAYALFQLVAAVGLVLRFPFRVLYEAIRGLKSNPESKAWVCSREVAEAANCDVWIIPFLDVGEKLPRCSVLFIHDLVTSHYPEGLSRKWTKKRNQLAPARAAARGPHLEAGLSKASRRSGGRQTKGLDVCPIKSG